MEKEWSKEGIMSAFSLLQNTVQKAIDNGEFAGTTFNFDQNTHLLKRAFGTHWNVLPNGGGRSLVLSNDMVRENTELFEDLMDVMLENKNELKAITDYADAMGVLKKNEPFALPGTKDPNPAAADATKLDSLSDTAISIATDGGKKTKNTIININKLVETITVSVTNLKESREQIKAQVAEALLTAVNDVNLAN
jgi:hypothetical protein